MSAEAPSNLPRPRRSYSIPAYLIAILALVLSWGGAATAGSLITSKQIKDNTITSADVKDGTLHLKDINKASRPLATPVSGTTVVGGGIVFGDLAPGGNIYGRGLVSLPFKTKVPLSVDSGRNLFFGSTDLGNSGSVNTDLCSGSAENPTAAPGILCVYVSGSTTNVSTGLTFLFPGVNSAPDGAESTAFYVGATGDAAGEQLLRFVWAYTAP